MSTATLTLDVFHRVAALSAFASTKSSNTPILQGVQLRISGGELVALATDRYTLARVRHEHAETDELEPVVIPTPALTEALKSAKNSELISITHDSGSLTLDWGSGQLKTFAIEGNYPPVERLFPDEPGDIPAGASFDSQFLARLSKLTRPARSPQDRVVVFSLSGSDATTGKLANLYAVGDHYDALISPRRVA